MTYHFQRIRTVAAFGEQLYIVCGLEQGTQPL
jgi:hypothetical protein